MNQQTETWLNKPRFETTISPLFLTVAILLIPFLCIQFSTRAIIFLHLRDNIDNPLPARNISVHEGKEDVLSASNKFESDLKQDVLFQGVTDAEGMVSFSVVRKDQNLIVTVQQSGNIFQTKIALNSDQLKGKETQIYLTIPDSLKKDSTVIKSLSINNDCLTPDNHGTAQ